MHRAAGLTSYDALRPWQVDVRTRARYVSKMHSRGIDTHGRRAPDARHALRRKLTDDAAARSLVHLAYVRLGGARSLITVSASRCVYLDTTGLTLDYS